jgi:hypothetical protein
MREIGEPFENAEQLLVLFKREWCAVVDQAPADLDIVRYWDLAATEKTEFNDPDWTVGVKRPDRRKNRVGRDPPLPMSVTFIPATVFNNPALTRVNPEYLGWLLSLPTLERERLLGGNWKIRPTAGLLTCSGARSPCAYRSCRFTRGFPATIEPASRPRLPAEQGAGSSAGPASAHAR